MLTDYLVIFAVLVVVFFAGYYAYKFIARNEQHIEVSDLRIALHDHENRIAELTAQRENAYDEWQRLDRSYQQLEVDFRTTAQHYAQCEADLIVTRGRLTEAADELLAYGVDIRADWDGPDAGTFDPDAAIGWDDPQPDAEDEHVEAQPSMFFDDLTAEYRQHNPHLAGNTETWMMPSPDIDKAIRDPYQRWNGFMPQLEPARVPAPRDGES